MRKVTDSEKEMIQRILADYERNGVINTEFYNTFGTDADSNKHLRGTFTSLKRKKIFRHCNDRGCFNPIYPTWKLVDVCREYGIEITNGMIDAMRDYIEEY